MARKRRVGGDQTRERILEVARPLFSRWGFAGTSVRLVATGAEVNVAAVAYHFTDKAGLYAAVVSRLFEDLSALADDVGPLEQVTDLDGVVGRIWVFMCEHREHLRLAHRHLLDHDAHPAVVRDRWAEPMFERVLPLVALTRPGLSGVERRMLVWTLTHLLVRFALEEPSLLASELGDPPDVDAAVVAWFSGLLRRELGLAGG